jgi:quercetin dioxygenase-like cupin family protein
MAGTSGTVVATPGDCEHSLTFDETEIQVLNFYLPTGFEQLLIGVSHPAEERGPPPQELIGKMLPPKALSAKLAADYGQFNMLSDPFTDPPDPNNIATRPTPGATVFPFTANVEDAIQSHWLMGGLWKILASGDQTGGSHCLIELVLRKGPTAAPHQHADSDEVVYILEGEMSFLLGDRIERASKGALVFIPRGYVHGVHVENEEAHSLNLHTPSGFKKFVELVGTPAAEKTLPPASLKDRDVDAGTRSRLMNEIGMRGVAVADPLT